MKTTDIRSEPPPVRYIRCVWHTGITKFERVR